ncbi:metal-dependent hydrolase [Lentibacillus sediminis]|uniref:metal-dependent hydrolase n=1 Tax=Lentibacillus sediminis TaxID=1940529 RepID=UPI000C1BCEF7|nr:metal-dependent hydrolase [Lentibacillus sediminis]
MNGTAHAAVGGAVGYITASTFTSSPSATVFLVGLGMVAALVPDLDIDGKLRERITLSHKALRSTAQLIGLFMIIYSFYDGTGREQLLGMGIGLAMLVISSKLKQSHMLSLTGIGVLAGGFSLQESWLILFGGYILIASFVSHRGYTHSIIGVIFFGIIASSLEASLGVQGVYYTCLAAYISHLVTDSKMLPFNKRGIKLFLPVSSKEV